MTDDLFDPYERLVRVRYLGRELAVPENNLLLRCFQFLEPEEVPYGDFCWNGDCRNCRLVLVRAGKTHEALACQTRVEEGDEILEAGPEVRKVLHRRERGRG
jgi:NADH dehydrogenase/NADH:ubiquinone oxidoreductase subunit G